jgi:F0F1-type ATP synthase delta subunit
MRTQKKSRYELLAKKYAQAFMHVYGNTMNEELYQQTKSAATTMLRNKQLLSLMHVAFADHEKVKTQVMVALVEKFKLTNNYLILLKILISDQRAFLAGYVLKKIAQLYEAKEKINYVQISSSHQLSLQDQQRYKI